MTRNPVMGTRGKADQPATCGWCEDRIRKGAVVCHLRYPIKSWANERTRYVWRGTVHWACYLEQIKTHPCVYCGENFNARQIDHVIPRSRGGADEPANLAPCCVRCNSSKGSNTPEEWIGPD